LYITVNLSTYFIAKIKLAEELMHKYTLANLPTPI
jgi:hypothetical protein